MLQPLQITLIAFVGSFVIFLLMMLMIQPKCILKYNNNNELEVSSSLLICFSLIFALLSAITTLIITTHGKNINQNNNFSSNFMTSQ
jgi:hypothetical protein